MSRHVTLLGAGLTGPLLAIYLARRGHRVDLHEKRPDMRLRDVGGGRSINLALSTRGLRALEHVGIGDHIMKDAIAMPGRMIHPLDGDPGFQPYGKQGQAINSISRAGLNIALLDCAEREPGVTVRFSSRCSDVDIEKRIVTVTDDEAGESRSFGVDLLISAEGAGSRMREVMERDLAGFRAETEWLDHAYKELEIPPGPGGSFRMEPHALHIWPRHDFMMIALPNPNATFTCTIFAPYEGENGFDRITNDDEVMAYMKRHFPDAAPLMPTLLEDWNRNPTSRLGTLFSDPWNIDDWGLLIGDAAHAIVPFYGQGMNCCFEDCLVLDRLMEEAGHEDWGMLLRRFSQERKPDSDAIARLAVENFLEMRSKVVDPAFLRRRALDSRLHDLFPDRWVPLYTMVTFTTLPYSQARRRAAEQEALLDRIGLDVVERAVEQSTDSIARLLYG